MYVITASYKLLLAIGAWQPGLANHENQARTIYVLPGPVMSGHKWSGGTIYDNISGPAGPIMLS